VSTSSEPSLKSSEPSLKRRAFLGVAAGGVAALAAPGVAQAASTHPTHPAHPARPIGIAARAAGPTPADWTALGHDLAGPLVRPGDRSYTVDSYLFDPRFDGIHPAGIAYVKNAHDVGTCLAFVRKFGVKFAARSGGHSYAGWSSSTGLIIDVENLKGVQVSGTTANVGAGTRLIDFYSGLAAKGRAVPGGSCPTVGIAGLTLGGGNGVMARAYGLTCDKLASLNIITADGKALTASPSEHSDLYWACRGGGGGNFGVVTWLQYNTVPAPTPVVFFLSWPWSKAAKVIAAWQSWAPNAPDALWSNLHLAARPGGTTPTIQVGGCYLGSITGAHNLIEQLYAKVGSNATSYNLNQHSFLNAMLLEAGCSSQGLQGCHLPWYASGGKLSRQPELAKSAYFSKPLSSAGISTLLRGVQSLQSVHGAAGGVGGVAFDALGGAVNRVKPTATAFVHRNALFGAQYTTGWTTGAAAAGINNQHAWLRSYWASMQPYANGQAYQNYIDPDLTNWPQAYYAQNYARLQQVKKTYDPTRLFNFPQAIVPAAGTPVLVTG
jgi:FAD/FMN-containing dehydrogenase